MINFVETNILPRSIRIITFIFYIYVLLGASNHLQAKPQGTLFMGPGVNLVGNAGFYGDYYSGTGQWATTAGMKYYLDKGMKIFRIPVQWEWLQSAVGMPLNPAVMSGIDGDVNYLTSHGARVIFDVHNYMRRDLNFPVTPPNLVVIGQSWITANHLADLWSRLATHYKNNTNVIFEIMNEPYSVDSMTLVASYNTTIAAIRSTGATNQILVDGNDYSNGSFWGVVAPLNSYYMLKVFDPLDNITYDVHQYLDNYGAGQSTSCVAGVGKSSLIAVTGWARTNHKKLFLGEFSGGNNARCYVELQALLQVLTDNNDVWMGYTWWGAYAGQAAYNNPDTSFWYSIDPGGGNNQDFSGRIPDDPRMVILQSHL